MAGHAALDDDLLRAGEADGVGDLDVGGGGDARDEQRPAMAIAAMIAAGLSQAMGRSWRPSAAVTAASKMARSSPSLITSNPGQDLPQSTERCTSRALREELIDRGDGECTIQPAIHGGKVGARDDATLLVVRHRHAALLQD